MSPASYLTAPPRDAGGKFTNPFALLSVGELEQFHTAFEHAARVGDLREKAAKLLLLLGV